MIDRLRWRTCCLQPVCDMGGISRDAVIKAIDPSSPCAGLVGLGDQLVAINGYRIACVSLPAPPYPSYPSAF
jgi:hypothetical protein